ncbi:MAG: tRNA 2-thiouridine(34) synthase MnmA [Myxococcota bacterium]
MRERWLVAMSGGVDSSVAAALLAREGTEVVGVTMDLGSPLEESTDASSRRTSRCCGDSEAMDARSVARALGIRHYVVNYRDAFRRDVVEPFAEAYARGETPIPCIDCNRMLKFGRLVARARSLGARGVATGHYARLAPGPDRGPALYRPRDRDKDQTYFLFDLPRALLDAVAFPLGELSKSEVRALARELGLATADKPESQDICFIPEGDVRPVIHALRPEARRGPGEIVDPQGRRLGTHPGAVGYTVGQRRGLGLSGGPWFVRRVEPERNRLVVGRSSDVERDSIDLVRTSWLTPAPPAGEVCAQVRHRQRATRARLEVHRGERATLHFERPIRAAAPGQAAVVYDAGDDRVLGGGWIADAA